MYCLHFGGSICLSRSSFQGKVNSVNEVRQGLSLSCSPWLVQDVELRQLDRPLYKSARDLRSAQHLFHRVVSEYDHWVSEEVMPQLPGRGDESEGESFELRISQFSIEETFADVVHRHLYSGCILDQD